MKPLKYISVLIVFSGLMGCALGPNFQSPNTEEPDSWSERQTERIQLDTGPVTHWWRIFEDPELNDLVERITERNYKLKSATARVRVARAMREASSGGYYPSLEGSAFYGTNRSSENDPRGIADLARLGFADLKNDLFEGTFDATWEIDVFGRVQRQVESAQAQLKQVEARRRDVLVSVLAETARNYVELRGFQERKRWLNRTIEAQRQLVELLESNHENGLVAKQRVLRAESTLSNLKSRRPKLETGIQARLHRLSVLSANRPGDLKKSVTRFDSLEVPDEAVPVGLRSDILRRRPDVRMAEQRLAEATANIGVAKARLFPRFFLTGSLGRTSSSFSDVFESASRTWSFGPSAQWSVLQGGRLRAELKAARGRRKVALNQYRRTVLKVLEDVQSSLVKYGQSVEALEHRREEVRTRKETFNRTKTNERIGLSSQIEKLRDRVAWTRSHRQMVNQKIEVQMNLIRLYKALGGGWKTFQKGKN